MKTNVALVLFCVSLCMALCDDFTTPCLKAKRSFKGVYLPFHMFHIKCSSGGWDESLDGNRDA